MITFRIQPHSGREGDMVEVFDDGRLSAALFARAGELKIVSKYLDDYKPDLATYPAALTAVLRY